MKKTFAEAPHFSLGPKAEPTLVGDVLRSMKIDMPAEVEKRRSAWSTWRDLHSVDTTAPAMLWEGFLPMNDVALLAGDPGIGKSTLARKLCEAIVSGETSFLGQRLNPKYRRVIYVSCEDNSRTLARAVQHSRLAGAERNADHDEGERKQVQYERLKYLWGQELSLTQILKEIELAIDQSPVDLIVLDSIGNMMEGDQNKNTDAQAFFKKFSTIAGKSVCLFLHHLRKRLESSDISRMNIQGAGAFVQRPRSVLMFAGKEEALQRFLWITKENLGVDKFKHRALVVSYDRNTRHPSADGRSIPLEEVRQILSGKRKKDLRDLFELGEETLSTQDFITRAEKTLKMPERTVKEHLKRMSSRGTLIRTSRGHYALAPEWAPDLLTDDEHDYKGSENTAESAPRSEAKPS